MKTGRKAVAADSSSLILLQKTQVLESLLQHYAVWVGSAVFGEMSLPGKEGARQLAELFADRQAEVDTAWLPGGMDRGEGETIALHRQGSVDFILADDKKAAGFCRRASIPFINSLLVVRILEQANLLPPERSQRAFARLTRLGYYSGKVIRQAENLSAAELTCFFP